MNERIKEIWTILGKSVAVRDGIERVRYGADSPAALYLGYKTPEMFPAFSLSVPRKVISRPPAGAVYRNLRLDFTADEINKDNVFINLLLTQPDLTEEFDILVGDFISHLETVTDQQRQATIFLDHFLKWQSLFEDFSGAHLSGEAQRGLFGELAFLKKWLQTGSSPETCISGWLGPASEDHDFKAGMTAVEVKTSLPATHQKLHISNERQLDDTGLDQLFVFHLTLEPRISAGQTLPEIIGDIMTLLANRRALTTAFTAKLTLSGYLPHQTSHYTENGYIMRTTRYYQVNENFPRICERDINSGVGDVKYTIAASALSSYEVAEDAVFDKLLKN